jgi:hypothetical protein
MPDHWEREAAARDMIESRPKWWECRECGESGNEGSEKVPNGLWGCPKCKATFDESECSAGPFLECPRCHGDVDEIEAVCPKCGEANLRWHDPAEEGPDEPEWEE